MQNDIEEVFKILLRTLADPWEEVIIRDLEVMAQICTPFEKGFGKERFDTCLSKIIQLCQEDQVLFERKLHPIVRQLCSMLKPEDIFTSLSLLVSNQKNKFGMKFIEELSMILLTAPETLEMRLALRNLETPVCNITFYNYFKLTIFYTFRPVSN